MARAQPLRRDDQPAFVLHTYPYRETSVIVEAFTAEYGRVAVVARGARRPRSDLRGVLQAFQPLLLSWSGQAELKTLVKAEWRGGLPRIGGSALLCGFYLNELLLKLLAREDPHPRVYASYEAALAELAAGSEEAPVLRRFELLLLAELGYALLWCARPIPAIRSIPTRDTITPSIAERAARRKAPPPAVRSCAGRHCSRLPAAAMSMARRRPRRSA
jgi:recombinational DNA repair protein (RecF pathway)